MSAAPADHLLGALIDGRYRIDREVGAGGLGTVYEAFHVGLAARVALKVLALRELRDPARVARRTGALLEEARTLKRLHHPNVAAALDVGLLPEDEDGVRLPYLVMEWCDGPTLKQVMDRRGGEPMPLAEAWQIFGPLLDALGHAHAVGVVHRDIKPGNVIVETRKDGSRRPRVVDFGIAKIVAPDEAAGSGETRTGSGSSPRTPRYAAPEQVAGTRTGPWTDVYALALVFVELVTGRPALGDGDTLGAVGPVLRRALSPRPADRYADASALATAMRAAVASDAGRPPARRSRRRQLVAAFAGLAAVVALHPAPAMPPKLPAVPSSFRGPLRDLPEVEIDRRVHTLGLGECFWRGRSRYSLYTCQHGTVQVLDMVPVARWKGDARGAVNQTALESWVPFGAASYAMDGLRSVIVSAAPEDVDRALDALIGDTTVEVRARAETSKVPPERAPSE